MPAGHNRTSAVRRLALTAVAVSLLTVGFVGVDLGAGAAAPARAGTSTLSGAYDGPGDVDSAAAFDSWRGARQGIVMDFVSSQSWSSISNPSWLAGRWQGKGYRLALSVPMLPKSGADLATGASGAYNGYFASLARVLVAHDLGSSVIRLGWEMNGTWFNWSAVSRPATYVSYWRQVVGAMRSVSGQSFVFDWSPNIGSGTSGFDNTSAYPGDDVVDIIGMSLYDQSWKYGKGQAAARWSDTVAQPFGLNWNVAFAAAHGKYSGMGEWGLSQRCDGHGGGDNPYYIAQMQSWFAAHNYYYETYFDAESSSCEKHSITAGTFPSAASAYQQGWSDAPVPTDPPASVLPSSVLQVSWSADRSNALPLDWTGLFGRVYIFADAGVDTSKATFYLDDPTMQGDPVSVEHSDPFDLQGGTPDSANPWDVSTLAPGTHTLTVAFKTKQGLMTATASFLI